MRNRKGNQHIRKSVRICLMILILALALPFSISQSNAKALAQATSTDLEGEIKGAPYRIRVPDNWNGILLIHLHGYRDKADHAGEVDDRRAEAAPGGPAVEQFLLAQGFAIAGSAYSSNGLAIKEGIKDTERLTNLFIERFGQPRYTILVGFSMGGAIALESMEKYRKLYDATLCGCGLGAGLPLNVDQTAGVFNLAYDAAFGWPAAWGSPGDVRDDLDFETEVLPVVVGQLQNPANFGRFEFIRLVTGMPLEDFYPSERPVTPYLFLRAFFATEAQAELERRAGGPVIQNLDHSYTLNNEQKTHISSLGVDADQLLAVMNAQRNLSPPRPSRKYLEKSANYTGSIKGLVLALHNRADGLVHTGNVSVYEETLKAGGNESQYAKAFVSSAGHCNFTPEQLFASITALVRWLDTGVKPESESFPDSLGFVTNFAQPAWPQPF